MQQHFKMLPTSRNVVSADGISLGPIGEVHVKFKIGKVMFNDVFVILNNLQCDIILGLLWQQNYRIGCTWNQEGKHFLTIENKFLALSITPHTSKQLVITKGQCTLQSRSITWISVKAPRNLEINSLFKITLDRQLPKELIPLDILHNVKNKQPQEMLVPLLNTVNSAVKLSINTVLGSITKVDNAEYVENMSSPQSAYDKEHGEAQPQQEAKPLLPVFPDCSSFQTHSHDSNKSPIQLQDANIPLEIQHKLNTMLNSKFRACDNNNGKVVSTFPLPKIQELIGRLNKCKYFSSLDLCSGYFQISLTEEAKKKMTFVTADGNYQWNVVPFALATTVCTFQYLKSTV